MNVLLIGGAGRLVDSLIAKLHKQGDRVFLLTGNRYNREKYERVFERYDFPYDSENLVEILESVNPEVTVFFGAFDSNYKWNTGNREVVRYTSGLINMLTAFQQNGKGRFIYLSEMDVFHGNYPEDIVEETPCSGVGMRGSALVQAEGICENFRNSWGVDVITLRLSYLYGTPEGREEAVQSICSRMCLEAMEQGVIHVNPNREISLLHRKDAMEYIHQCIRKEHHERSLYNLSSDRVITELEIAQIIRDAMEEEVTIQEEDRPQERCVLSGRVFQEEFGVRTVQQPETAIKRLVTNMEKRKSRFLDGTDEDLPWWKRLWKNSTWFLKAAVPFVENIVCFIPFFMLNNRVTDSAYFANLDPYLLYVLLFAIVHGQHQATFSAVLAVAGYLFRQTYTRTGFAVMLDYNTYVWAAQLFILGLVVGYMRDEIRLVRGESRELEQHLSRQIVNIQDINNSNVRVKEALEQEIVLQKGSIGKIYDVTSRLEQYMPDEVLFYAVETLADLLGTRDIAIYNVVNGDYARIFSAGSAKARSLGNSIRYRELESMYTVLMDRKVYINKSLDAAYPQMANGIFEGEQLKTIIMIWGLGWEQMTLGQANFLSAISFLIRDAVLRANNYLATLEEKRYLAGTRVMEADAFISLVNAYRKASNRELVECTLLEVSRKGVQTHEAGQGVLSCLRASDYVGILPDRGVYVLLTNTNMQDAAFVGRRLQNTGYEIKIVENLKL